MKKPLAMLLIACLAYSAPMLAQSPKSPLLGKWVLDVESVQAPLEMRPKSVTMTYSEAGDGKWRTDTDVVGREGNKIHATATYPLNGTAAPSKGYPTVDTTAVALPTPNVMVAAFYLKGMPRTTRTYTVAADGKTMLETVVWLNINGKPEITTNHFNRVE
ncbi:hypothetical protein JR064_15350 [Xanthomonas sp. CFBP 8703]|uniref:LuxR family transcriptional regulator n=1 Tax=Xanthomonas bonasiae TaxID=2810351 RepID=A0ABS3B679_9XANT|nr:hypothetical protein [Xanthomonas bonasiae]MBN6103544.1 hypothetical protein [Xanthomonas bonasiae]